MPNLRTNNLCGQGGRNAINGSVYFPGYIDGTAAEYLAIPDTDDLNIGTGDFTFECWVRGSESYGEYAGIFGTYDYDNAGLLIQIGNTGKLRLVNPNNIDQEGSTIIIPQDGRVGDWHHIAVTRASGTIKGYVNGIQEISHSFSDAIDFCVGGFAVIGVTSIVDHPGDYDLKGFISNLRVCKGHAVYTANFTPPTSPLTVHYISENDKTSLLCCQDSDDPTQEATDKTITAVGGNFQTGNKNILLNGDFSQGTTGFIGDSGASISESGGVMTVTNGGGDNLYALKQNSCLRIGGKYRCTATVTPTFASGNPVFRVRFGGSAESFVQQESTMSTGVAFRIDTGEKVADGRDFEIGSGNSSGITQFTITDLVVTAIDPPIPVKNIPPYGVDAGNTFGGAISMNSSSWMYFPTGRTEGRGRGRGLIMGNYIAPTNYNTTEFITIQSLGNSQDFGDMSQASRGHFSFGSSTRAIRGGGYVAPANVNTIEFFTIAQTGNAVDFGDITNQSHLGSYAPISNQTRGIFAGGYSYPATFNNIDYVTIASTGNSIDFGGMTTLRADGNRSQVNSSTRGLIAGGYVSPTGIDNIEYLTIATLGNSTDFGDLTQGRGNFSGLSSSTRGIFAGGTNPSNNIIDFVTIASTGNATDFGDMIDANSGAMSATSNNTRGVIVGGDQQPANYYVNTMQYVTIATTGNAQDFGDALTGKSYTGMTSDSHGGLS